MTNFRDELLKFVKQASEVDKDCQVFGAKKHKYQFNPPASEEDVAEFERKFHITLPDEYRYFLTHIGNGGAGPHYGMYSLKELEDYQEFNRFSLFRNNEEIFLDNRLTLEKWNCTVKELDAALDNEDDELAEMIEESIYQQALVIGTQGCTYGTILMCGGSEKGKIIYYDMDLCENYMPYFTEMKFSGWILNFFKEIAIGNSVEYYGLLPLNDEKELIELYKSAKSFQDKRKIFKGFSRFRKVKPETLAFLRGINERKNIDIRMYLLFRFDTETAIKLFEQELYSDEPSVAIDNANLIAEEEKDRYYTRMVELLYSNKELKLDKIMFFMDKCKSKKAKDLVKFVLDENNNISERATAVYVMGHCEDFAEFADEMVYLMKNIDDKHFIITAIQASKRANLTGKNIKSIYQFLKEKFRNDLTIRSNLENL